MSELDSEKISSSSNENMENNPLQTPKIDGAEQRNTKEEEGVTDLFHILCLTFFVFPVSMISLGIGVITPMFIGKSVGNPVFYLGIINTVSSFLKVFGLIAAYFSDRCTAKIGRRTPFILAGGIMFVVGCVFLVVGITFEMTWIFVIGNWIMALGGGILGQAFTAMISEVASKSRLGLVGGLVGLWTALGGSTGLTLVSTIQNYYVICSVFVSSTVVGLVIVLQCVKEKPLPADSEILIPLNRAETMGQKICFAAKDFVSSFLFPLNQHPDFFLYLLYRGFSNAVTVLNSFSQYYLGDVVTVSNPAVVSAIMFMIVLLFSLINSPIFGFINDRTKRPRMTLIAANILLLFCVSIDVWGPYKVFPIVIGPIVSGIASAASSASSMPVTISVLPSRDKTAQFIAEITLFELVFNMSATQLVSFVMSSFSISHMAKTHSSETPNSPFSPSQFMESLLSPVDPRPKMYTMDGYIAAYSICMCFQGLALLVLMFINTERSRKAQEKAKTD